MCRRDERFQDGPLAVRQVARVDWFHAAIFIEFHPDSHLEGDPIDGKGKREYESYRLVWTVSDGEHAGKEVATDTSTACGPKSNLYKACAWLFGKNPTSGELDLMPCVGKDYLLTMGNKPGKQWIEVVNAMLKPNQ